MSDKPPLWPAHLHHLCIRTPQPEALASWYSDNLELSAEPLDDGRIRLRGRERNLVLQPSPEPGLGFAAYAVAAPAQVAGLRDRISQEGMTRADVSSPLFTADQVAIADPDGNVFVYGMPSDVAPEGHDPLPGRLQHVGITTTDIRRLIEFYTGRMGFRASDIVSNDDGAVSACFLRCDDEHHALALFAASSSRFDHQCYETTCWNDIRDWGDHFSKRRTIIEWGAARHGAGNNLFIFVRDPDRNPVELSAELETRPYDAPPGQWKTEERTLNLWGSAWTRT